jgi:hypothetical protein
MTAQTGLPAEPHRCTLMRGGQTSLDQSRMLLQPLLRAHAFMRTEAPPELWEPATEDTLFLPLRSEMIAAALRPGSPLSALTLAAANVVVPEATGATPDSSPTPGEYVAVSVTGPGAWTRDWRWLPTRPAPSAMPSSPTPLLDARVQFAYGRSLAAESSITIFLARITPESGPLLGPSSTSTGNHNAQGVGVHRDEC